MEAPLPTALLDAIGSVVRGRIYTNYSSCSGYALVIADFFETFPDEVRLMWPGPWSIPKVLFFSVRYCTLAIIVIQGFEGFRTPYTVLACRKLFTISGMTCTAVIFGSEGILFFRVYAFSGRSKKMLIYLLCQFIMVQATLLGLILKFLINVQFVRYPFAEMQFCRPVQGENSLIGTAFAVLLGNIAVIMVIMGYLAHQKHRGLKSELLNVFYRDGISYFICLSGRAIPGTSMPSDNLALIAVMTSVNVFVNFAAAKDFQFLFLEMEIALHGILSTRMILHLRRVEYSRVSRSFLSHELQGLDGRAMSSILFEPQLQSNQPTRTVESVA
ncbi:hypothetical protein DFP72DRAFT_1176643 [Ephemerocybe angulata]|uniref:DUF6533 domain-containing protein n=1 Tax=Ephemerocybe angulata TaxID=980116 RepID=A0A8H6HF39_9AGAR|nr:hypothetical protein DFP72DRAFT_1176643 [Tulosesus angulatus]